MKLRHSFAMMAVAGIGHVVAAILGGVILCIGVVILNAELHTPPFHPTHIYIAAGFIGFGALLIVPGHVTTGLRSVIVVVGPYLPGGRRASDHPSSSKDDV